MAVSMPGTVLSSLIFRLKTTPGDAVGFLLGNIYQQNVAAITDLECQGTKVKKKICIQQYQLVEGRHSFADNSGEVNCSRLEALLNDTSTLESVAGWFVYRCNCSSRPSMLERMIHRSLMNVLPHSPGKDLVFAIFGENSSGLLSVEYCFYQWIGSQLQLLHVDIVNLQSTSIIPYQVLPLVPIPSSIGSHAEVMKQAREELFVESGELKSTLAADSLCRTLLERLKPLKDELIASNQTIQELDREVQSLQVELDNRTLNNLNSNDDLTPPSPTEKSSDDIVIPALIQLGDNLADLTSSSCVPNGSISSVDLLTGSPPPSANHTPWSLPDSVNDNSNEVETVC